MRYWLMKTEPSTFSIDDLAARVTEPWDGVRNFQARNNMKEMEPGDRVFIYHSSTDVIGIAGIGEVAAEAHPDQTAFDPSSKYFDPKSSPQKPMWWCVDVRFVAKFPQIITLTEIRGTPGLEDMVLTRRGSRLSVQPVSDKEWEIITGLTPGTVP